MSEDPEATGRAPGAEVEVLWELVAVSVVAAVVGWLEVEDGEVVEEDVEEEEEAVLAEVVGRRTVLMEMRVSEGRGNRESVGMGNRELVGRPVGLPSVAVTKTVVPRLLAAPQPNMDMPPSNRFW